MASLWIGRRLHYLNQLCLLSHVRQGHPTTLYCTDEVSNVPAGVTVRPASEIMSIDMDIVRQTSESFLSNVFRYKMIQTTDAVWIDCDAFCHRPFPDEMKYIYAGHGFRGALNCGVVYLPRDGELIGRLLDYYENLPGRPCLVQQAAAQAAGPAGCDAAAGSPHLQCRADRLRAAGVHLVRAADRRL